MAPCFFVFVRLISLCARGRIGGLSVGLLEHHMSVRPYLPQYHEPDLLSGFLDKTPAVIGVGALPRLEVNLLPVNMTVTKDRSFAQQVWG